MNRTAHTSPAADAATETPHRQPLRQVLLLGTLLLLAACASATPYQSLHDGYGYSAQLIESNRYRVSFAGSSATPRQTVENYMLYQAAELTLRTGSDYFIVTGGGTQASGSNAPTVSFGFGGFSMGGHGGVGMGVGTSTGGGRELQYTASSEILVFQGKKPDNNPQAFDAREVKANLEAQIQRPAPDKPAS